LLFTFQENTLPELLGSEQNKPDKHPPPIFFLGVLIGSGSKHND
jgi:hypothetical protein